MEEKNKNVNKEELFMIDPEVESSPIKEPISLDHKLLWPTYSTHSRYLDTSVDLIDRKTRIKEAITIILKCLGEDPNREGLLKTPERFADAMLYYTSGYSQDLAKVVNEALFQEKHDEMIILKDISVHSLCEHHLVPFINKASFCFHFHFVLLSFLFFSNTFLIAVDSHRIHSKWSRNWIVKNG